MLFVTDFDFKTKTVDICDTEDCTIERLKMSDVYNSGIAVCGCEYNYKHDRPSFFAIRLENKSADMIKFVENMLAEFNNSLPELYNSIRRNRYLEFDGFAMGVVGSGITVTQK